MELIKKSHRHSLAIIEQSIEFRTVFAELENAIDRITDQELIDDFLGRGEKRGKSLSKSINSLIKKNLKEENWHPEAKIFKPEEYSNPWKLDFAKSPFSVEVAFNHGEATAWNLMKPVIASEINHVEKEIDTEIGVIVVATEELKKNGGFDTTIKTFEALDQFILPLTNYLTVPIVIVGLKAPKSFKITHVKNPKNPSSKLGEVTNL